MTTEQAAELLEAVQVIKFMAIVCGKALCFAVGLLLFKAWWYAKNQRDFYVVPLALALCGASTASAQQVLFDDQFDGPDGQYLALHTPDVDASGLGWTQNSGTYTLQGNELNTVTSPASWFFNAAANGIYTLTAGNTSGVGDTFLVARYNPSDGTSVHVLWRTNGEVRIRQGTTTIGNVGNIPYNAGASLSFKLDGTTLSVLSGSTVVCTGTNSLNLTSTKYALNSSNIGRTFARVRFTTLGPVAGGFANPALIHNDGGGRSWVIESVGTPPSFFGSGYDNSWDPRVIMDVLEVSSGVTAANGGSTTIYTAAPGSTPFWIRTRIQYGGKFYYAQGKSTIASSALVAHDSAIGTSWNGWKGAIDKWEAANPTQEGFFVWVYAGASLPPSGVQTFSNNPGVAIQADEEVFQVTQGTGSTVTLIKFDEESTAQATVWLLNDANQWHKWKLVAEGVTAEQVFSSADSWEDGTPPREDASGFGPPSGDPGNPEEPPEDFEPPAGVIEAIDPPFTCAWVPLESYGLFYIGRGTSTGFDRVEYPTDNWASDIREITAGSIVTFCGRRWWRVLNTGGKLVIRTPNRYATAPKWVDQVITAPRQSTPPQWNGHDLGGPWLYYLIPDGYSKRILYGNGQSCGPGSWDEDCDGKPDPYDKDANPCGWEPGMETWDHDCDEIPNHYDEDYPPPWVPIPEDQVDSDGDGTPDVEDDDIDNDGTPNDQDPTPHGGQTPDDELMGCPCHWANKNYPHCDGDEDGVCDAWDWDDDGDGIPDATDPDSANDLDGDGISNFYDEDDDGDGISDWLDDDQDGDGFLDTGGSDNDSDGDGTTNDQDDDIDGDGVNNNVDADVDGDGIPNANDDDVDGDGRPNAQDSDDDGDGEIDTYFPPEGNGAGQTTQPTDEEAEKYWEIPGDETPTDGDIDEDGIIDSEDPDRDGDGIPNESDPDANGDGVRDRTELGSECRVVGYTVRWTPVIGATNLNAPEWDPAEVLTEQQAGYRCEEDETLSGFSIYWRCCKGEEEPTGGCGCDCFEKMFREMDDQLGTLADKPIYDQHDDDATFAVEGPDLSILQLPQLPLGGAPGIDLDVPLGSLGESIGIESMRLPIATEQGYAIPYGLSVAYLYLMDTAGSVLMILLYIFLVTSAAGVLWRVFS